MGMRKVDIWIEVGKNCLVKLQPSLPVPGQRYTPRGIFVAELVQPINHFPRSKNLRSSTDR